ncbi:unnamed protein product [Closterium sp. Yama58-4]|nr:unnamed protein product [Closterium sp. Yama58-4]
MAPAGSSSMGNGKACVRCSPSSPSSPVRSVIRRFALSPRSHAPRRVLAVMTCLLQPSQAAPYDVYVYVEIGGQMTINGQPYLPFKGTRCANNLDTSGVVKPQVQVSWQPGTDASKAACRAFDFFQDFNCKGPLLGSFPDGKSRTMALPGTVKSARCIIDDLCPYVSCPFWSNCVKTTDDSAYARCKCIYGYVARNGQCQRQVSFVSISLTKVSSRRCNSLLLRAPSLAWMYTRALRPTLSLSLPVLQ